MLQKNTREARDFKGFSGLTPFVNENMMGFYMKNLFKKNVPAVSKRFPRFYYDKSGFIFDGKVHAVSKRFMWFNFLKNS